MRETTTWTRRTAGVTSNGRVVIVTEVDTSKMKEKVSERCDGQMVPSTVEAGKRECNMVLASCSFQMERDEQVSSKTISSNK